MEYQDSRLSVALERLVEAIGSTIHDLEITQEELHAAADYLDRVGAANLSRSLLDVFFAVPIVNRQSQGVPGTRPNLEGPYYTPDAPVREDGVLIERAPQEHAEMLLVHGHVRHGETGAPIPGAELDVWQVDEHQKYDLNGFNLRGKVLADDHGYYEFRTILPQDYGEHEGDEIGQLLRHLGWSNFRAAHIHLKIRVNGETWLTTQLFRGDSPHLENDYVRGAVSDDLIMPIQLIEGTDGSKQYHCQFDFDVVCPADPSPQN